jgi:hypothetical protein
MGEDKTQPTDVVPPYPLAMVVCDAIWRDPGTGKQTLLGLFSTIHASEFPTVHPIMALHIALTDGHGKTPIRVRLIDASEQHDPLFEQEQEVEFQDPRVTVNVDIHLSGLRFEAPGEYRFQLYAGATPLMERRILVLRTREDAR